MSNDREVCNVLLKQKAECSSKRQKINQQSAAIKWTSAEAVNCQVPTAVSKDITNESY